MNWKIILSKTKEFILIVAFIIIFKSIFGAENTLIGVTTITAMLLFLGKDLTLEPTRNTLGLVLFNVMLGILAYLATTNMYLGFLVNFIAIFVTAFILSYNLKSPGYIPFTLQYLFMLATPVTVDKLSVRLASLVCGAVAIMVTQLVVNRNRIKKYGNGVLRGVCVLLFNKIRCINNGEDYADLDKKIVASINSFEKIVYEKRKRNFYLTEEGRIKLNLALSLNELNILLNQIKNYEEYKEILEDMVITIDNIKICFEDEQYLEKLEQLFLSIYEKYKDEDNKNINVLKFLNIISFIHKTLVELNDLGKKNYDFIMNSEDIPNKYNLLYIYKNNFTAHSLRFSFAFRYALGVAIGAFITDYFGLSEGRWIIYTISALSQPQYELSKEKSKNRIFATVVGTVIISILFAIITDTIIRSLVIVAAGYIGGYLKEYKYNMICVTVSAVGAAALFDSASVFSVKRLICVILGMIIAMLLARFVFPYKIKDANSELINIYRNSLREMLNEIKYLLQGKKDDHSLKNLILVTGLVEDKLITNNSIEDNKELDLLIEEGRALSLNIFVMYEWIKRNKIDKENFDKIIKELEVLVKGNVKERRLGTEELIEQLEETHGIKDRITISNIIVIYDGFKNMSNIKVSSPVERG